MEEAEALIRENNVSKSIYEYERVLQQLESLDNDQKFPGNIREALDLLNKDVTLRIKELQMLQDAQSSSESLDSSSNSSISKAIEGSFYHNGNSVFLTDPLLLSITNKLENNLVKLITSSESNPTKIDIMQQVNQFKRELSLYEQKKSKEYDFRLEQVMKENKKLSNQVNRLKDRWDSLVESARLKRDLQQT